MFDRFQRLLKALRLRWFTRPCRPSNPRRARCNVEALEDRLVPTVFLGMNFLDAPPVHAAQGLAATPATPSSQPTYSGPAIGDAFASPVGYVFSGGDSNPANATKWAQPNGLGSPITITYSFSNLLDGGMQGVSVAGLKAAIQEALSRWAGVAPLNFVEVPDAGPTPTAANTPYDGTNDPMIRFGHFHIDGPYNVLAYTYYPTVKQYGLGGDVGFDDSESWSLNPNSGIDFLEVAEHEIGHAIGLAHELPPSQGGLDAIMNPVYAGRFNGLGTSFLYQDDASGVEALYGAGQGSVTPLVPAAPPAPPVPPVPPMDPALATPFVRSLYLSVLGRAGNSAEVAGWVAMIAQGASQAHIAQAFVQSDEALGRVVDGLYVRLLGRHGDPGGVAGFMGGIRGGASEEDVGAAIAASPEFLARAEATFGSSRPDVSYVKGMYAWVLGRTTPEGSAEDAAWVGRAHLDRVGVAQSFLQSGEFRSAQITDFYFTLLHRSVAPPPQDVAGWASSQIPLLALEQTFASGQEFLAQANNR